MMEIRYNITGAKRKEMAQIIGKVLETEPVYLRVPTCAYAIGKTLITKEGSLIIKGLTQEDAKKKRTSRHKSLELKSLKKRPPA